MFSPVIMLLLGGFTIAAALSKHYIAKAAANNVLSRVKRPSMILLATMLVSTVSSMWISNVAAPSLVFSLINPILRRQTYEARPLSKVQSLLHSVMPLPPMRSLETNLLESFSDIYSALWSATYLSSWTRSVDDESFLSDSSNVEM